MDTAKTTRSSHITRRPDPQHDDKHSTRRWAPKRPLYRLVAGVLVAAAIFFVAISTRAWWLPLAQQGIAAVRPNADDAATDHAHGGEPSENAHARAASPDSTSLALSEKARKNIGLELVTVAIGDFDRTVSIPAVLVTRSGRAEIVVSAPMTGIVRRVYPIQGEAVRPGDPLFEIRLTHEDLVEKQSKLLRALEELDVVKQEVARLDEVTASGAVAGKRLLERQYEQRKIEALIRAERQALMLHGLDEAQVDSIAKNRRLLQSLTIVAPQLVDCADCNQHEEFMQVGELSVTPGRHVAAGTRLCTLTDHCQLYIEGNAFEHDADALTKAANRGAAVTAIIKGNGSDKHEVDGLRILYVENRIEVDSRALKFYLRLPNKMVRNELAPDGKRFISWQYRPGQRVEVFVPMEQWKKRIILPIDAVLQEGPEWFVYQQIGGRFQQKPVHVEYRGQRWAVIESDGTLFPGDVVAGKGAYQIHLALKNKVGGGVDPHAGHNH